MTVGRIANIMADCHLHSYAIDGEILTAMLAERQQHTLNGGIK